MKKIYEYLYYRLYTWNLKTWGAKDGPEFNASLGIAFLMGMHLSIFILVVDVICICFFNILYFLSLITKGISVGLMGLLIITTYFWFVHKKKYLKIIKKYKDETQKQKLTRGYLLFLYIILTFVIIFFLAYIGKHCQMLL